jgi:hypothetical protein
MFSNSRTRDIKTALVEKSKPEPNGALVRIRTDGKGEIVATGIYLANGTAIDPKEEAVCVLESTRNDCLLIAIKKDGTFGKPEIYAGDFPALPDGMAFAADGTLFVTLPAFIRGGKMAPAHQIIEVDKIPTASGPHSLTTRAGRSSTSQRTAPLAGLACKTSTSRTWKASTSAGFPRWDCLLAPFRTRSWPGRRAAHTTAGWRTIASFIPNGFSALRCCRCNPWNSRSTSYATPASN